MQKNSYKDYDFSFLDNSLVNLIMDEFSSCMKYEETFTYLPTEEDFKILGMSEKEAIAKFIDPQKELNDEQRNVVIKLQNALVEPNTDFFQRPYYEYSRSYEQTNEIFQIFILNIKELNLFDEDTEFYEITQDIEKKKLEYQCLYCGAKFNPKTTHKNKQFCCDCGLKGDEKRIASNHKMNCCYKDWKNSVNSLREKLKYYLSEMHTDTENPQLEREEKCIGEFLRFCYSRIAMIKFKYYTREQCKY